MPVAPSYPGVYIEEVPSGVRTLAGVATSITAFIGRALRGPENDPVQIFSYGDYERTFGGLWVDSTLSYAVQQYFLNGGSTAVIVRVSNGATAATLTLEAGGVDLALDAASAGDWGNYLRAKVDHVTREPADTALFNLIIEELDPNDASQILRSEKFLNVSVDPASARYVAAVLREQSRLVRVDETAVPTTRPNDGTYPATADSGADGDPIDSSQVVSGTGLQTNKQGLWALENADLFNILCIPPYVREPTTTVDTDMLTTYTAAAKYCKDRRAMLVVDPPAAWESVQNVKDNLTNIDVVKENSVLMFPRILVRDPLKENRIESFAPCGAVAGIFGRTDAARGVWKAPAGIEATISGATGLAVKLTDSENGELNPLGVNCLRSFPVIGRVVWGSRTVAGADKLASEWKYLPVRRLALFLEESLYRGTQWVVFEPNDEPLWSQIRLNVGAFMQNLFLQGAFQGASPREAYFVKCDKETTTQNDINLGIVNIVVGFAPLKPAEFVIIKIQQIAGNVEA